MKHQYLKDSHWYIAFVVAIIFWFLVNLFIQPANPINLLKRPELILVSIIIYPILEEIVFRGLLQPKLLKFAYARYCLWGISGANVMTSMLFALLHLINQPPQLAIMIFVPSLIFGYFRDRHKTIYPSIGLHIFYNLGFIFLFSG